MALSMCAIHPFEEETSRYGHGASGIAGVHLECRFNCDGLIKLKRFKRKFLTSCSNSYDKVSDKGKSCVTEITPTTQLPYIIEQR